VIVATFVVVLGLLIGAWAATTRGYRLGGVVVASLLAVYTLVSFASLPVFLLSTAFAYVGIGQVQERWLVYGRRLLLTAILLGMVTPVALFLGLDVLRGGPVAFTEAEFLGSIFPGIAAYNFHREDEERRLGDALASVAVLGLLLVAGVVALVLWATPPCTTCAFLPRSPAAYVSPLLLGYGSDVATSLGYATAAPTATVGTLGTVSAVVVVGLTLSEVVRTRLGLRPVGVITLPLVALFALRAWWVVPLYLAVGAVAALVVAAVHRRTLLYGRALLSLAGATGVSVALVAMALFGLPDSLVVFFGGLLGGIGAYNVHVAAPRERVEALAVSGGVFVVVFAVARALVAPLPGGLATPVTAVHLVAGAVVLIAALRVWARLERDRPSAADIRDAAPFGREVRAR
jgi:hypothetical protein